MRLNPFSRQRREAARPVLLAVTPPRTGERTLLGVENLLQSIAAPEPFSLELAGHALRASACSPAAPQTTWSGRRSGRTTPKPGCGSWNEDDRPAAPARRASRPGRSASDRLVPAYAPLRTFRDRDLLDPGSDPLLALVGALGRVGGGRTARRPAHACARWDRSGRSVTWPQALEAPMSVRRQRRPPAADRPPGQRPRAAGLGRARTGSPCWDSGPGLHAGWRPARSEKAWPGSALWRPRCPDRRRLAQGALEPLDATGSSTRCWCARRWSRPPSRPRLRSSAICARRRRPQTGRNSCWNRSPPPTAATTIRPGRASRPASCAADRARARGSPWRLQARRAGSARPPYLGVRELAALWHPPGAGDETYEVGRSGAKALPPPARTRSDVGAHMGDVAGRTRPADPLSHPTCLRRHHLYVARTQDGQVDPDAPPGRAQAQGEGRRPRLGTPIVVDRPARRPGGGDPRTGAGVSWSPRCG